MVMLLLIEWVDRAEVIADWSNMIGDNIDHDVDVAIVTGLDQVLEIVLGSEVAVQLLPVTSPIAMVALVQVVDHR